MRDYFSCLAMPGRIRAPDSGCVQFGGECGSGAPMSDDFGPCRNGTLGHFLVWDQPHSYQRPFHLYPQPCRDYSSFGGEMDSDYSPRVGEMGFSRFIGEGEGATFGGHGSMGGGHGHHGGGGGYYGPGYGAGGLLLVGEIPDSDSDDSWFANVRRMSVGARG